MTIEKFIPSPQLQPYIHQYYLVEGDFGQKTHDVFFADGCLEIVFNMDLEFYRDNEKESWAKVIGQITQPLSVEAIGKGKSFGIWFAPHGFSMFSNVPVKELTDKSIPLDTIFDRDFIDFVGNCLHGNDINNLVEEVDNYFERIIRKPSNPLKVAVAEYVVQQLLYSQEESNLEQLARDCNVSLRYLQKIFLEKIGLGPKYFQRVSHFQQALHQMTLYQQDPLTSITYQAGYFDQSHFIREFKRFTGFVPSQYRLENHPINQHFLNS